MERTFFPIDRKDLNMVFDEFFSLNAQKAKDKTSFKNKFKELYECKNAHKQNKFIMVELYMRKNTIRRYIMRYEFSKTTLEILAQHLIEVGELKELNIIQRNIEELDIQMINLIKSNYNLKDNSLISLNNPDLEHLFDAIYKYYCMKQAV